MRFCTALFLIFFSIITTASGQTRPVNDWQISILTFGPGSEIFERYGHVAIRLKSDAGNFDVCYDWGNFSFYDPDFLKRFIKADTRYSMEGKDAASMIDAYSRQIDRTVVEQVLNLTPAQTHRLLAGISVQDDEDHRYYAYDYFRDNCATRVRDAIDDATDHAVRDQSGAISAQTYRSENRRVVPVGVTNIALMPLMDMAMGPRIDVPLTQWEDCFLPGRLADQLDMIRLTDGDGKSIPLVRERRVLNQTKTPANFEPTTPMNPAILTLPIGLIGAAALMFLARRAPLLFKLGATLWMFVGLLFAAFMIGLICFTRHWVIAWNENLLQFTVLSLPVLWCIWLPKKSVATNNTNGHELNSIRDHSCSSWRHPLPAFLALTLSVIGTLVTISHLTPQANAPGVLLALPLHAATYFGLRRLTRHSAPATSLEPT